jgi:hypothetical protein
MTSLNKIFSPFVPEEDVKPGGAVFYVEKLFPIK